MFEIQQADYDMLLANLQFEPVFVREQMNIRWHCENGMIENIQKLIEEYRAQRNLTVILSIQTKFFQRINKILSAN